MIQCILSILKEAGRMDSIHRDNILLFCNFLHKINGQEFNPSFDIIKNSLGIFGDLCEYYQKDIENLINRDILRNLLSTVKLSNSNSEFVDWVYTTIQMTFPDFVV